MALTEAQLAKLKEHVIAGDRIGYYSQIAEWVIPMPRWHLAWCGQIL